MTPDTLAKLRRLTRTLTASEALEIEDAIIETTEIKTKFAKIINKKDRQLTIADRTFNLIIGESTEIYIMNLAREGKKKMGEV